MVTIILGSLITLIGEKVEIRTFPLNLMYVLAWLVVIPAISVSKNGDPKVLEVAIADLKVLKS